MDHERDSCLGRLDELGEIALHASLGTRSPCLEKEVILERAQIMVGEGTIDLDHRLPEATPEHRRQAQIVDCGVLEEVVGPDFGLCFGR